MNLKMEMNKLLVTCLILVITACGSDYSPKPMAYPRVDFPPKNYTKFWSVECPFSFEIPAYSEMQIDDAPDAEPCWYNLVFKPYDATLHISYKPVSNLNHFDSMYEDTRVLTMKHFEKADQIAEYEIYNPQNGVSGLIYTLKGNTATNYNFFITDSSKHFLRGALYFNNKTRQDSVLPAFQYMVKDVERLIQTAKWKTNP